MTTQKDAYFNDVDELYKIRETNSRKSMAATYIYLILRGQTDEKHHMTQKTLADKLAASPINIELDRKSISRIVYSLADEGIGISALPKKGVWYDSKSVWYNTI